MKLCVAQTRPVKGEIQSNIASHKKLVNLAVLYGAVTIIFPELSVTGYEPKLAKALATTADDHRFNDFQEISDAKNIIIGIGVPTKNDRGTCISMILFHPHKEKQLYSKKYLHADEEPFFVPGENSSVLINDKNNIALAICYELSIPEHAVHAFNHGARTYIASVAKTAPGVEKASVTLSGIARNYSMTVLMANCIGHCDNFDSAGKTSAWNSKGKLAGQLNDTHEGILIFDIDTGEIIEKTI